jgi:hypothetical protein
MACGNFIVLVLDDPKQKAIADEAAMDLVCLECNVKELMMETGIKYLCYYCEEVVYYGTWGDDESDDAQTTETWRHQDTGLVACNTVATPSNLEALEEGPAVSIKPTFKLLEGGSNEARGHSPSLHG